MGGYDGDKVAREYYAVHAFTPLPIRQHIPLIIVPVMSHRGATCTLSRPSPPARVLDWATPSVAVVAAAFSYFSLICHCGYY